MCGSLSHLNLNMFIGMHNCFSVAVRAPTRVKGGIK